MNNQLERDYTKGMSETDFITPTFNLMNIIISVGGVVALIFVAIRYLKKNVTSAVIELKELIEQHEKDLTNKINQNFEHMQSLKETLANVHKNIDENKMDRINVIAEVKEEIQKTREKIDILIVDYTEFKMWGQQKYEEINMMDSKMEDKMANTFRKVREEEREVDAKARREQREIDRRIREEAEDLIASTKSRPKRTQSRNTAINKRRSLQQAGRRTREEEFDRDTRTEEREEEQRYNLEEKEGSGDLGESEQQNKNNSSNQKRKNNINRR